MRILTLSSLRSWPQTLLLTLALASTSATADLTERPWWRHSSQHFQIYSDLPPRQIKRTIESLETFHKAVAELTNISSPIGPAHETRFFIFRRPQDFRQFHSTPGILGYMMPGLRFNLMVAVKPSRSSILSTQTTVVFHEYIHQLVRSASAFRYPAWYEEGFAELLSTARQERKQLVFGHPPRGAMDALQHQPAMPLAEMLRYRAGNSGDLNRRERFYAKAWLFTHYLLFSEFGQRLGAGNAVRGYLRAYDQGQLPNASFEQHFGMSTEAMDGQLQHYLSRIETFAVPTKPQASPLGWPSQRLTTDEVRYELGNLMLAHNGNTAARWLGDIHAQSPLRARALAALGLVEAQQENYPAALAKQRQAAQLAPADYLPLLALARTLLRDCAARNERSTCKDPAIRAQALAHYRRAYELAPDQAETQARYGQALVRAGQARQALPILLDAAKRVPGNYQLVVDLGVAHLQQRQWQASQYYLQRARGWSVDSPSEQARLGSLLDLLNSARNAEQSTRQALDSADEQSW